MRTVEVSRFVAIQPDVVERALTPTNVIEYEGTFEAVDIEAQDDGSTHVVYASKLKQRLDAWAKKVTYGR